MTGMIAWTREQITRREEAARAAADHVGEADWSDGGEYGEHVFTATTGGTVAVGQWTGYLPDSIRNHIALNDPAAVLRRCAADRKILDGLLAQRHDVVDDCWYTCAAATEEHDGGETCDDSRRGGPCDCGRDARIERYARLLAEGYGWTEGT